VFQSVRKARTLAVVMAFILVLTVSISPPVLGAQSAQTEPVVIGVPGAFAYWPSTEVTFEVIAVNTGTQPVTLRSVGLKGGFSVQSLDVPKTLPSFSAGAARTPAHVREVFGLSSPWQSRSVDHERALSLIRELGDSFIVFPVHVDLKDLKPDIQAGEPVPVTFDVSWETAGGVQTVSVQTEAIVQPMAVLPGFVRGDIHLHTKPDTGYSFVDDGLVKVSDVITNARDSKQMDFLSFASHAQMLGTSTAYDSYSLNISAKAGTLPASAGLEMSTRREYNCVVTSQTGSVAGTPITSWIGNADDGYYQTTLPFTFRFFGKAYNTIYISTNGFVSFSSAGASSPSNTYLPNPSTPNAYIAPFWRDLDPGSGGAVYLYKDSSVAKVTWYDVPIYGTSSRQTFQCVIGADGTIQFNYMSLSSPGYPTVGVEDDQGQYGKAYSGSLYTDMGLQFQPSSDSHYIVHGLSGYLSNPNPETRTGQEIITAVNGMSGAYGGPAHPYSADYPWRYWVKDGDGSAVTGFQLIELMTSQSQASSSTLSRWDQLLLSNLQTTISSGKFLVGVSTSDMHTFSLSRWGLNMSYVMASSSMSAIHTAIKAGKVVASADGTVTSFSAKVGSNPAKVIGEVLPVNSGQTITLSGQIASGATISSVRLIRNGSLVTTIPVNPDKTWSTTVTTTSDCYYRIEVVTSGGTTYTNPIFINVL
jgi:hypothetical protein